MPSLACMIRVGNRRHSKWNHTLTRCPFSITMGDTDIAGDKSAIRQRQPTKDVSENAPEPASKDEGIAAAQSNTKQQERIETFSSVFKKLDSNKDPRKKRSSLLFGAVLILAHFIVGVLCMMYFEEWYLHDAVYFCMVTLTTVGYGDLSPTNTYSKIFVVYYVLVSMTLISSYLTELVSHVIDHNSASLFRRLSRHAPSRASRVLVTTSRSLGLMGAHESDTAGALGVLASSALVGALLAAGFAIYIVQEGLGSVDAAYATIISASTVGFGDLRPTHARSKLLMTVWLVFATIALAKLVGDFEEAREKAVQRDAMRRVLAAHMDEDSVRALFGKEKGGDIEWGEFVCAVLVATGKVERVDVMALKARFRQFANES